MHALGQITIPDAAALCSSTVAATQVFVFVQSSFSATTGLLVSLALLVIVRKLERREPDPAAALALSPAATPLASVPKRVMVGAGGDRA